VVGKIKQNTPCRTGGVAQVVECLLCKCQALSSIKKIKNKNKIKPKQKKEGWS
jgi:hypothetical protein